MARGGKQSFRPFSAGSAPLIRGDARQRVQLLYEVPEGGTGDAYYARRGDELVEEDN